MAGPKRLQHRFFLMNIAIFKNTFFKNICEWLLLITAINRRYFEKYLLQNFNYKMLHNSISVDRKLYSLQQKQKSTAGVSNGILRTATFTNTFWGCFRARGDPCGFRFSLFSRQWFIKSWKKVFTRNILA